MIESLSDHWPEYLIEGALLGVFMVSACLAVLAVEHPASPIRRRVGPTLGRRAIVGAAMGLTAVALIYSPWGARSGAHMNPAVTIAFLLLGRVGPWDAAFYIASQVAGGVAGVVAAVAITRGAVARPPVAYITTVPGRRGVAGAFAGEFLIAAIMMTTVLAFSNSGPAAAFTGFASGLLVSLFIAFEAPYSGMSLNPARTLASALPARSYRGLWVYLTAPVLGMASVAWAFDAARPVACAKLNHAGHARCIFPGCRAHPATPVEQPADRGVISPRAGDGARQGPGRSAAGATTHDRP